MADISAIFHWPPEAFADMSVETLMDWRERAVDRAELLGLVRRRD